MPSRHNKIKPQYHRVSSCGTPSCSIHPKWMNSRHADGGILSHQWDYSRITAATHPWILDPAPFCCCGRGSEGRAVVAESSSAEEEPEPEVNPGNGKGISSRMDAEPTPGGSSSSYQSDVVLREAPCGRWSTMRVESSSTGASASSAHNEEDPAASYPIEDLAPRRNVHVTLRRIYRFGPTPGCKTCSILSSALEAPAGGDRRLCGQNKRHTVECKQRFAELQDIEDRQRR